MSIDNVVNFIFNKLEIFNKEPKPEFFIEKRFFKKENSSVLKIILPPRGRDRLLVTKVLIRRFRKRSYSSLEYFFPEEVLYPDPNDTLKFFDFMKNKVRSDIRELKEKYSFDRIDIIAPSLAVVSACLVANNNEDISNIYLLVPGSCLASSLWKGIRTEKLKRIYEKQNIKLEQLQTLWKNLAPKNNINALDNKNIFIAISKSDKVIPYSFRKELADLVKTKYPQNTSIVENGYLGHYFTVLKYYFFSKKLLE